MYYKKEIIGTSISLPIILSNWLKEKSIDINMVYFIIISLIILYSIFRKSPFYNSLLSNPNRFYIPSLNDLVRKRQLLLTGILLLILSFTIYHFSPQIPILDAFKSFIIIFSVLTGIEKLILFSFPKLPPSLELLIERNSIEVFINGDIQHDFSELSGFSITNSQLNLDNSNITTKLENLKISDNLLEHLNTKLTQHIKDKNTKRNEESGIKKIANQQLRQFKENFGYKK